MIETDILVVGGGLAAIKSGIEASKSKLRVVIATKGQLCGGASFFPMMDMLACQASTGVPAEDAMYLDEIMDASLGMADEAMNRIYIRDIRKRVAEFPEIGVDHFHITEPKIACFAKTARPTYVWSNWPHIRENARRIIAGKENISLIEKTNLIGILTCDRCVNGAVFLSTDGELLTVHCKSIILATGGMGDLFEHNLNTQDVSGDGQVLALHAGASLINIEFNQFIPGFLSPAYKTVFRETSIPYMETLRTEDGMDLLAAYLSDPADRKRCLELRATHGPFTNRTIARYFDIAMMTEILKGDDDGKGFRIRYRPDILNNDKTFLRPYIAWLKDTKGVDLSTDEIRIAPFFHAANGGVKINTACSSSVNGLYACGEVSGGIHGADRLGGHSSGSCLVFGAIAGENAARYASGVDFSQVGDVEMMLRQNYGGNGLLTPDDLLPKIRRLMFRNAGIIREAEKLNAALTQLQTWQSDYSALPFIQNRQSALNAVKTAHFLVLGQALLTAMLARNESRGSHYRKDYPEMEKSYEKRHLIYLQDGRISVKDES